MSSQSSTSTIVDEAVAGGAGAGGLSGPPASTDTAKAQVSASANSRLFMGHPPFAGADEQDSIVPIASDAESLFEQFWEFHTANDPRRALSVCDLLLERLHPSDFDSHLRQSNARAMALRGLKDYRAALVAHLSARPLVELARDSRLVGCHFHGLGMTLTELGEHDPAYKALRAAREYYAAVGDAYRVALADINTARLYVRAGRPGLAFEVADRAEVGELRADAEIVRAMAYEAEGNRVEARRAIHRAFLLLADSTNETTRAEALEVLGRIERRDG